MIDQLPSPKAGELIEAEHIAQIVKAIRKRTPRNSPTVRVVESADGFWLEAKAGGGGGGGGFSGAWKPSYVNEELINLTAGSISDGITTFTPTVTDIVVDSESLNYVYLECDTDITTVGGYVVGGTITAAIVKSYTTTKTNTNTKAYLLLCVWQTGTGTRYRYFSQSWQVIDDGGNTGTAQHFFYGT